MATHDQVAHNWMHETGRCRNGHHMYYDGVTIYSYGSHFPIAKKVTAPNGERIILFNDDSYSVSTSKHQTIVRRAIGYDRRDVLRVPARNGRWMEEMPLIRAQIVSELPEIVLKWKRARSFKEHHARLLRETVELVNRINVLWQLGLPDVWVPEDILVFAAEIERLRIEERKAQDLKDREAIRKWLAGEPVRPPHTHASLTSASLEGRIVQTSWGISVPLKEALPIFRLARLIAKCGSAWVPRKIHKVGGWTLDRILADGTVRAGCHSIPFKVQLEAAKLAGLA